MLRVNGIRQSPDEVHNSAGAYIHVSLSVFDKNWQAPTNDTDGDKFREDD